MLNEKCEHVVIVIYGLGRLNVIYETIVRKLKFYKHLYIKSGFLHDVFWAALLSDSDRSVFIPLHVVYTHDFMSMFMSKISFYLHVFICLGLVLSDIFVE